MLSEDTLIQLTSNELKLQKFGKRKTETYWIETWPLKHEMFFGNKETADSNQVTEMHEHTHTTSHCVYGASV